MRLTTIKERLGGRGRRGERLCVRGVGGGVLRLGLGVEDWGGDRFWSVRVVGRLLSAGVAGALEFWGGLGMFAAFGRRVGEIRYDIWLLGASMDIDS